MIPRVPVAIVIITLATNNNDNNSSNVDGGNNDNGESAMAPRHYRWGIYLAIGFDATSTGKGASIAGNILISTWILCRSSSAN